jgi:hypothetical protein
MNDFHRPTPEEFDVLARDQKLDGLQAYELGLVLYHVDEDLKEYRKRREGRKPRRELVRRLKRFADLFNDLEYEIDRSRKTMADFLPLDAQEEIGQLMSYGAIEAALNREIPSRDLRSEIESLTGDDPDFRMAQIEASLEHERRAIGLKDGPELLAFLIKKINQPIKTWFAVDRLNRGGRPTKNPARDLLLFRLAEAAPVVIGRRATATARGRFVRLCAAVVAACGLDDRGIERSVEKAIKELTTEQRKGFRRIPKPPATPTESGSANS